MNTYTQCIKIENGIVVNVIQCKNLEWCNTKLGGTWLPLYDGVQCGIGYVYDSETNTFSRASTEQISIEQIECAQAEPCDTEIDQI